VASVILIWGSSDETKEEARGDFDDDCDERLIVELSKRELMQNSHRLTESRTLLESTRLDDGGIIGVSYQKGDGNDRSLMLYCCKKSLKGITVLMPFMERSE
jgi:hypothetical protein